MYYQQMEDQAMQGKSATFC